MDIRQFHLVLRARNFDQTRSFYGEVMGLPEVESWEEEGLRGVRFQAGPGMLEVLGRSEGGERRRDEAFDYQGPDQKMTLALTVASAEKAYEDMIFRYRNIPGGLRREADGSTVFETHDPDGVKILFRERAREAATAA